MATEDSTALTGKTGYIMEFTMAQENNKSSSLKRIDKFYLEQVISEILEVRIRMINLE